MAQQFNYTNEIPQVMDYIDRVIRALKVDDVLAEEIRSDAFLDIAGRIKKYREGKTREVMISSSYLASNVRRLMHRHHDMRRRGVVGSALQMSGTRISAMKRYSEAVHREEDRLGRELSWREKDAIGTHIRETWHDPAHRPPIGFWRDNTTCNLDDIETWGEWREENLDETVVFNDEDIDILLSSPKQKNQLRMWERLASRLPIRPVPPRARERLLALLDHDPFLIAKVARRLDEEGSSPYENLLYEPFCLDNTGREDLLRLLLLDPRYSADILISAYEIACDRYMDALATAHFPGE